MRATLLCIAAIIFTSLSGFAEENAVYTDLSPRIVKEGQWATVTFYLQTATTSLTVDEPPVPEGVRKTAGPNIRPFYGAEETVPFSRGVLVRYVFKLSRAGRTVLEPFRFVLPDGETVRSDSIILRSGIEDSSGALRVPFDTSVTVTNTTPFEGEPVAVRIAASNVEELKPFSLQPALSVPQCVVEEIPEAGTIEANDVGVTTFYTVPVASYLITPLTAGEIIIPGVSVTEGTISVPTSARTITVQERPEQIAESGAIGTYQFEVRVEAGGAALILHTRLSGQGNLNFLTLPEPETRGFVVTDKKENRNIQAGTGGYSGTVEQTYVLSPRGTEESPFIDGGPFIRVPRFYWLDGKSRKIVHTEEHLFYKEDLPEIAGISNTRTSSTASSTEQSGDEGNGEDTQAVPRLMMRVLENTDSLSPHTASSLRRARAAYVSSNFGRSVFELRKALLENPARPGIRDVLVSLEKELKLHHQITLPLPINPLFVFIVTVVLFAAAGIGMLVFALTKKTPILGPIVLFLVLAAAGSALSSMLYVRQSREWGVARSSMEVRKIPRSTGSIWFTLPEGTAFHIVSKTETFYLIRTGNSMEGWASETDLFIDRR